MTTSDGLSTSSRERDDGTDPSPARPDPGARLSYRQWGDEGAGNPVLLLHGMLSSKEYWNGVAPRIRDRRVIAMDLLGFGASPRPADSAYDYRAQCDAILATLEDLGVRSGLTLVGHSMGALVALRLAATRPDLVADLRLIGMPIYASTAQARAAIASSWFRRKLLYGNTSRAFCTVWCQTLRPVSRRLAPLYLMGMPPAVARATVEHSWRSYSLSLLSVVEDQRVAADLAAVTCPVLLVHGHKDRDAVPPSDLVLPPGVQVRELPGGHQLPLRRPDEIAALIRDPL